MPSRTAVFFAPALAVSGALALLGAGGSAMAEPTSVSHGMSTFGELKYAADFTHFAYVNPDAPKGGKIVMRPRVKTGTFDSFNPYIFKGDPAGGAEFLFDTLMTRAHDEPDAMYGLVAESIEMPADRRFVIFTLREAARFSDGAPVTAEDVAWSIETLKSSGAPDFSLPLKDVAEVAFDNAARTLRVDFVDGASTRDLPALVASLPIFSKAHFADKAFSKGSLNPPVGSGPYRVNKFEPGRFVSYELREDYWARDLPARRGQFNFGELRFEYYRDNDSAFEAFKSGQFDLVEVSYSKNWATKYNFEEIQNGQVIKEKLPDGRPAGARGFWINNRKGHLQDRRVREAIDLAFDFEWSNKSLFYDLYLRSDSLFENTAMEAVGPATPEERELLKPFLDELPADVLEAPYVPPINDGSGRNRDNMISAQTLLDSAGWKLDGKWRKNAAGEVLTVEFLDRIGPSVERMINPFVQNLQKLGIKASLRGVDAVQYQQRVKSFDYDVLSAKGFDVRPTPGPELRVALSSVSAGMQGSRNLAGIDSPVVDFLLTKMSEAETREDMLVAARCLDRVFRANRFWVAQWHRPFFPIAYWNKFGRPQDLGLEKPEFDRGVIGTWWYDVERSKALKAARSG